MVTCLKLTKQEITNTEVEFGLKLNIVCCFTFIFYSTEVSLICIDRNHTRLKVFVALLIMQLYNAKNVTHLYLLARKQAN